MYRHIKVAQIEIRTKPKGSKVEKVLMERIITADGEVMFRCIEMLLEINPLMELLPDS